MEGASSSRSAASAAPKLHKCRHFELHNRELGGVRPSLFAHRIGGCEDVIQRLEEFRKLTGHRGCVNTVHFNPSGDRLISGSDDKQIMIWDWMAGRRKLAYHSGHEHNVFQARVMPFSDDSSVVSCAADGQVRHGLIMSDGRVDTKRLGKHRGPAHKLAIEPGSPRTFFSCGEDGVVQHFDLRDNRSSKLLLCQCYDGRSKITVRLNSIVINPRNPNYFAVGGADEYARVYDIRKIDPGEDTPVSFYAPKHLIGYPHVHITCVAYSQQEELLVSYNDELIYLFQKDMDVQEIAAASDEEANFDWPHQSDEDEVDEEEEEEEEEEEDAEEGDTSSKQSDDEEDERNREDENVDEAEKETKDGKRKRKEDVNSGRLPQVYKGHRNAQTVKGVNFFGPNSEYVVSGSDCGHIFIWKKQGGKLMTMLKGDRRVVNCLEPHPFATFLATSGMEKTIKLWAPTNDKLDPFPPNAERIMERNKTSREDLSITPEIIMRVLHLQNRYNHSQEHHHHHHHHHHQHRQENQQQPSHQQQEADEYYNMMTTENSEEESSDDSLGSPRECIIS